MSFSVNQASQQMSATNAANPSAVQPGADTSDATGRTAPDLIHDEDQLLDHLTRPRPVLVEYIRSVSSPLLILGAGGKMGPTLAVLARRAAALAGHRLDIIAVSRFSDETSRRWLESQGVSTTKADVLEPQQVKRLPDAADVIYLVGLKFGTRHNPALTWAANTLAPAHVSERYGSSRLVALSTGNVYPMVPADGPGAREDHSLTPLGEYANAAVARERIFEYMTPKTGTRTALLRLSYAVELRYGVMADIARKVHAGEAIDLTTGYFNCIWQGDANELILRSLALTANPPAVFNLSGPAVSVRDVAMQLTALFGRPAVLTGTESATALLSDSAKIAQQLGPPPTLVSDILRWTAHWVKQGGKSFNKPTHFEVRDGVY